jgi:hypothetical protein
MIVRIDPQIGRTTTVAHLRVALADAAAVASKGRAVVVGGGTRAVYELTVRP